MQDQWVPTDFTIPLKLETGDFHLEPLGPQHNERDHNAWMSSIEHIHNTPGFPRGDSQWPYVMPLEENLQDLEMHQEDFTSRKGFTYSVLEGREVIGCVYIYPSSDAEYDAEVMSWVTANRAELDVMLWKCVSNWLDDTWPFKNVLYHVRLAPNA